MRMENLEPAEELRGQGTGCLVGRRNDIMLLPLAGRSEVRMRYYT